MYFPHSTQNDRGFPIQLWIYYTAGVLYVHLSRKYFHSRPWFTRSLHGLFNSLVRSGVSSGRYTTPRQHIFIKKRHVQPNNARAGHNATIHVQHQLNLTPQTCTLLSYSLILIVTNISTCNVAIPSVVRTRTTHRPHIKRRIGDSLNAAAKCT